MPAKTASIVSVVLTVLMLLVLAVIALAIEIIALNGASERQGFTAIGIALLCQGLSAIVIGILAWKATGLLIAKYNLKPVLAVVIAVILGALVGGALSFLSIVISIPLAGIR